MKRAVLRDIRQLSVEDVELPACPPDGLRVRTRACGVCATDVKIYNYGHHLLKLPRVLGHELAGDIDAVGEAAGGSYAVGQRVAVVAGINCMACRYCSRGAPSMCENLEAFGYHYDGGYAEYFIVPANSIRCNGVKAIPDHLDYASASVMELLACIVNGQELSGFTAGESVLILGAGPVGILHARLAKATGCGPIFLADISPERVAQAQDLCSSIPAGVFECSDAEIFRETILEHTDGIGCDQVMVACGAPQAQALAMQVVDKCGCVNFFGGLPRGSDPVEIDTNAIHYRHIRVVGTHGSSPHQNDTALSLIADDCIAVSDLITGRIGLESLEDALTLSDAAGVGLKTVVTYG